MNEEYDRWKAEQARVWLEHIRGLRRSVRLAQCRIDSARDMAMPHGISYERDRITVSANDDLLPSVAYRVECAVNAYNLSIAEWMDERDDAVERISRIPDADGADVLIAYYVCNKPWKDVDAALFHGHGYSKKLRDRALPLVYDVMPAEWKTMLPRADF